jgi:hypothetical protein
MISFEEGSHGHVEQWITNMRRREFITLVGGAGVMLPGTLRAQREQRVPRVGFLQGVQNENVAAFVGS